MKVGRHPEDDRARVRDAVGEGTELFVDANGAYTRKQALAPAECYPDHGVTWLEYLHDHVRVEHLLFDGALGPEPGGVLRRDRSQAGLGLELRAADAERWGVAAWS